MGVRGATKDCTFPWCSSCPKAVGGQEVVRMVGNVDQGARRASALGFTASRGPTDTWFSFLSLIKECARETSLQ